MLGLTHPLVHRSILEELEPVDDGAEDEEEGEGGPLPGHGAVLQAHQGHQEAQAQHYVHVPGGGAGARGAW